MLPARAFTLGGRRKKPVVEAEQMASFVAAWSALHGVTESEFTTTPRDDENDHDFDMVVGGITHEVELTALLSDHLRGERR